MIRARVRKISKNENTYKTDLNQVNFIGDLPKKGEPMKLLTGKMSGGVQTSVVTDVFTFGYEKETVLTVMTLNSTYEITIQNEDLEGEA